MACGLLLANTSCHSGDTSGGEPPQAQGGGGRAAVAASTSAGTGGAGSGGAGGGSGGCGPFVPAAGHPGAWPDSATPMCGWPGLICLGSACTGIGVDGDFLIDPPSYTLQGARVADDVTGLTWERQPDPTPTSWSLAKDRCDALVIQGNDDWRLPSLMELSSLPDYGRYVNATIGILDPALFTLPPSSSLWTATLSGDDVWVMSSIGAFSRVSGLKPELRVGLCVRGLAPEGELRLDASCSMVIDPRTGRTWQRGGKSTAATHEGWMTLAIDYCSTLALGGFDDWRLPNVKELMSLVAAIEQGAVSPDVFALAPGVIFSSASAVGVCSSELDTWDFWGVSSDLGSFVRLPSGLVRCVR